jgi:adenylate kinase
MFIGRKDELRELQNIYGSEGFQMVLIHGKPGTGKTTLLEEFCKDKDTIFFTAKRGSSRANLTKFSMKVLEHYEDKDTRPFSFWEHAFSYIKSKQDGKKIIVVIDNFSEIAERDPVFMNVLCNSVDNELKDSNIVLILTSGNEKFIQRYLLTMTEPIAKKLTNKIHLDKFLNEETISKLQEETMKRSKGIDRTKFIRVNADDVIQREGEESAEMYKVVSGTAISYLNYGTEKEYLLGKFKEGASFGEYPLLTGKPALCSVVAFTDMLLLRISRDEFRKFISMNVSNAVDIMRVQAKMISVLKLHVDMLIDELHS